MADEILAGDLVVNIKATTDAFSKAMGEAKKQIDDFSRASSAAGGVLSRFASDSLDKIEPMLKMYGNDIKTLGLSLGAFGAAITASLGLSVRASAQQEETFRRLQNQVEITGNSWANTKPKIDAFTKSMQATTKYGDTETAAVLQKLMIFTSDFDTALKGAKISMDMAASGMFNVDTAARYVGMALSGNITELGRYIPEFRTLNNETLKNMSATEKATYAMDVLQKKFGGLAEKELKTFNGQLKQLGNYLSDISQEIGDVFLPVLTSLGKEASGLAKNLGEFLEKNKGLTTFISALATELGLVSIAVSAILLGILALPKALTALELVGVTLGVTGPIAMGLIAIGVSIAAITARWPQLKNIVNYLATFGGSKPGITSAEGKLEGPPPIKTLGGFLFKGTEEQQAKITKERFLKEIADEEEYLNELMLLREGWAKKAADKEIEINKEKLEKFKTEEERYTKSLLDAEIKVAEERISLIKKNQELQKSQDAFKDFLFSMKLSAKEFSLHLPIIITEGTKPLTAKPDGAFVKLYKEFAQVFKDIAEHAEWELERVSRYFWKDVMSGGWMNAFIQLRRNASDAFQNLASDLITQLSGKIIWNFGKMFYEALLSEVAKKAVSSFLGLFAFLGNTIWKAISSVLGSDTVKWFVNNFVGFFNAVGNTIWRAVSSVLGSDSIKSLVDYFIDLFKGIYNTVTNAIDWVLRGGYIESSVNFFISLFKGIYNTIRDTINWVLRGETIVNAVNFFISLFKGIYNTVTNAIDWVLRGGYIESSVNFFISLFKGIYNTIRDNISNPFSGETVIGSVRSFIGLFNTIKPMNLYDTIRNNLSNPMKGSTVINAVNSFLSLFSNLGNILSLSIAGAFSQTYTINYSYNLMGELPEIPSNITVGGTKPPTAGPAGGLGGPPTTGPKQPAVGSPFANFLNRLGLGPRFEELPTGADKVWYYLSAILGFPSSTIDALRKEIYPLLEWGGRGSAPLGQQPSAFALVRDLTEKQLIDAILKKHPEYAKYFPEYQFGGIIEGMLGQKRLIQAHAGEEVITRSDPRHRDNLGGITINITGNTISNDMDLDRITNKLITKLSSELSMRQRFSIA